MGVDTPNDVDEYVVFVAPSIHQLNAYGRILNTDFMGAVIRGETDKQPLGYSESDGLLKETCLTEIPVDMMRKIANTPTVCQRPFSP